AKAVYNLSTTRMLIDRLMCDKTLRRICGWERQSDIPSESTFSRAFAEFADGKLAERVHEALIGRTQGDRLVGHISRDSTEIDAREKPAPKQAPEKPKKKRKPGRPKKGEEVPKEPSRLERQAEGMSLPAMLDDLPQGCDVGAKRDSKGHKKSWIGYKLHIDAADGSIPISCVLTSASVHDSQVAIPLATLTNQRVTNCYDLMDSAYDAPQIRAHSESLDHVPLIDINTRRNTTLKEERQAEDQRFDFINFKRPEDVRYNERSTVERVNGRLKDEFGGRTVRVRGHAKVMTHLMFGILALTVDQLMRFLD
ncbi:MAG: transposase, partial [bacterium]|nr:transposase [bacterium]